MQRALRGQEGPRRCLLHSSGSVSTNRIECLYATGMQVGCLIIEWLVAKGWLRRWIEERQVCPPPTQVGGISGRDGMAFNVLQRTPGSQQPIHSSPKSVEREILCVQATSLWGRERAVRSPSKEGRAIANDGGENGREKRWTFDEAIAEIRPLYRKGIRKRNELVRQTGIPAGTVSRVLRQLRESERATPLKSQGKTRSISNLENVELSRLMDEQAADKEASPLDDVGDNPRVDTY